MYNSHGYNSDVLSIAVEFLDAIQILTPNSLLLITC